MTATITVLPPRTLPKISFGRLLKADGEFQYRFEEMEIDLNGIRWSFSGEAQITYWIEEEGISWFVGDISIDTQQDVERDHVLYLPLWSELTDGSRKDSIQDAVEGRL